MSRLSFNRALRAARVLTVLAGLLIAAPLFGRDLRFTDPVRYLGMTLESALDELGEPGSFYPLRGETPHQDTVVFYYSEYVYLYWFEDRVWQVRFDHRFEESVMGIRFGDDRLEVRSILGSPAYQDEVSLVYELDHTPFPVRVRVFFVENAVHDIYIYRGDF